LSQTQLLFKEGGDEEMKLKIIYGIMFMIIGLPLIAFSAPVITVPADVTLECDFGTDPSITGTATATISDPDCTGTEIAISNYDVTVPGSCLDEFTITRTWTASACGESSSGDQIITVSDTTVPEITLPADVTVAYDTSTNPSITGTVTAIDNCDLDPTINYSDVTENCVITRTWTATDDCSNSSSGEQIITLVDISAPLIVAPANVTVACDTSTDPSITGTATATDDDDPDLTIEYIDIQVNDVITRTWTATDDCGNEASADQIITLSCPEPTGTIIVEKQTDPVGAPDSFTFSGDASGTIADSKQIVVPNLPPGTYTSQESVPSNWNLTSIQCDDDNSSGDVTSATATFQLEEGETVKCTFVNELQPVGTSPCDNVLDDFNRKDGRIGPDWRGARRKLNYRIKHEEVQVRFGGPIYWREGAFGPTQEACVTLTQVCKVGWQSILLKVQSNRRGNPKWWRNAIAVFYDAFERKVGVETFIRKQGWTLLDSFNAEMQDGDQLGARALGNGAVEVYVNGVLIGTADAGPFFVDKDGFIGLWSTCFSPGAVFDDFGSSSNTQ